MHAQLGGKPAQLVCEVSGRLRPGCRPGDFPTRLLGQLLIQLSWGAFQIQHARGDLDRFYQEPNLQTAVQVLANRNAATSYSAGCKPREAPTPIVMRRHS
jgi:hypothetical protein